MDRGGQDVQEDDEGLSEISKVLAGDSHQSVISVVATCAIMSYGRVGFVWDLLPFLTYPEALLSFSLPLPLWQNPCFLSDVQLIR